MIPAILAGAGALMSIGTLKRAVQDWMTPDLSDEARAAHERNIGEIARGLAQNMSKQGYSPEQIQAELQSALGDGQIDDGPQVGVGELALAAAGLIPGVGLARMGLGGAKAAFGAGRAAAQEAGKGAFRSVLGGVNEVASQAGRMGIGLPATAQAGKAAASGASAGARQAPISAVPEVIPPPAAARMAQGAPRIGMSGDGRAYTIDSLAHLRQPGFDPFAGVQTMGPQSSGFGVGMASSADDIARQLAMRAEIEKLAQIAAMRSRQGLTFGG